MNGLFIFCRKLLIVHLLAFALITRKIIGSESDGNLFMESEPKIDSLLLQMVPLLVFNAEEEDNPEMVYSSAEPENIWLDNYTDVVSAKEKLIELFSVLTKNSMLSEIIRGWYIWLLNDISVRGWYSTGPLG